MPEQLAESGVSSSETFVSIVDVVQKLHAAQPDKPVLRFLPDGDPAHEIVWDYTRLTTRAKAVAAAIGSTGKGDGCPVLLMLPPARTGIYFVLLRLSVRQGHRGSHDATRTRAHGAHVLKACPHRE